MKAAELRNETAKALADSARTGRCCAICGYGDHKEDHHRLGAADAAYTTGLLIEWSRLAEQEYVGGAADIYKCFGQLLRKQKDSTTRHCTIIFRF